jgi:hypothetical protein
MKRKILKFKVRQRLQLSYTAESSKLHFISLDYPFTTTIPVPVYRYGTGVSYYLGYLNVDSRRSPVEALWDHFLRVGS